MTERAYVTTDWGVSPRLVEVASPGSGGSDTLSIQDLNDSLKSNTLQASESDDSLDNMDDDAILDSAGKEALGNTQVGITSTLLNGQIAFEANYTPAQTGTATSADLGGTSLTDISAFFQANSVTRGAVIVNYTDQSIAEVTKVNGENQLDHRILVQGINNDWGIGDVYKIWNVVQKEVDGGNIVAVDDLDAAISPIFPTAFTQVVRTASSSATLSETAVSGLTPSEAADLDQIHGQVRREIWLDPSLVSNGNGYQQSPYNNLTDAIDDAELNGITSLVLLDDITLDRNLKNFTVRGIGVPTVDFAGFDLKGCRFYQIKGQGTYIDVIIMQECVLLTGCFLNGFFENCALAGDLTCVASGTVFMKSSASNIAGLGRPTISLNGAGTTKLSVRDHGGGLTIKDCNNVTDEVTVEMGQGGSLTFDASCTNGAMVARTNGNFVDATAGATVTAEVYAQELHKTQGLRLGAPMTVTPTSRTVDGITQVITGDGDTTSTVTRQ